MKRGRAKKKGGGCECECGVTGLASKKKKKRMMSAHEAHSEGEGKGLPVIVHAASNWTFGIGLCFATFSPSTIPKKKKKQAQEGVFTDQAGQ